MEVIKVIKELSNSTTMGHDTLDSFTLKLVTATAARPIQHILNLSNSSQKFCNKWKLGCLIPLHKGGNLDRLYPKSYRQISILPIILKIMECIV